ncbi:MAG: efflux transporter outer rane subunit [Chitinophagaceae bacterium]|nr:efflux transporter outer rane subunit [Chitinophagaceae bacterium]
MKHPFMISLARKRKDAYLFFLLIVCLLCACSVGRHYERPHVLDDSWTWKNQVIRDTATAYTPSDIVEETLTWNNDSLKFNNKWWLVFGDDSLNQLIQTAFDSNPTLKNAAFRIMESRGMLASARSYYYPTITFDPNISRQQLAANRPSPIGSNQLPEVRYTTINVPLDMSYELDVWGKFRRSSEAAEATLRATQADYEVVKLNLSADIASNYFNLRLIDNQIQLYTNSLALRNNNLKLTSSQYNAGITTKLDVVQAEIEASTVESQLIEARRSRAVSENAIAVLCGIPVMNLRITARKGLPVVPKIPLEIPSDLLQHRPDIVEAEQNLIAANAQIGVADAAFFPSVKVTAASAGFQSSRFDNIFQRQSQTWIGGVGLSIPIFTGGRNIANKNIAEARYKESQAAYQQVVLNAFREVQDAMTNIEYRSQQSTVLKKVLNSAHTSADMSKELYQKGLTTYINVITADRAVLDAENSYISVTGQRLLYSISLIKALGGGWK